MKNTITTVVVTTTAFVLATVVHNHGQEYYDRLKEQLFGKPVATGGESMAKKKSSRDTRWKKH